MQALQKGPDHFVAHILVLTRTPVRFSIIESRTLKTQVNSAEQRLEDARAAVASSVAKRDALQAKLRQETEACAKLNSTKTIVSASLERYICVPT